MKLEFKNINKFFDDFHVLKDVSFTVSSGQIFGFLGRNGAGKTTTLRILMDVFKADSGQIFLDDKEFLPQNHKIGYLPEERGMYSKSKVRDQLIYFSMLRGATKKDAVKSVQYWTGRFEIDQYLNSKLETLSKGNQQKVQITQAFLNEPDVLILDEPFSGLDPVNASLFQQALSEYISDDKIIIFSSHQMGYVESFCDNICIIEEGKIILEGNLEAIKKSMGGKRLRIKPGEQGIKEYLAQQKYTFSEDEDSLIVELSDDVTQTEFLKDILDRGYNLEYFAPFTPSLQEIFVSMVGGSK